MEDPNLVRQYDPLFHTNAEQYGNMIPGSSNGGGAANTDYATSLDIFKQKEKPPTATTSATNGVYVDLDGFYQQERPNKMLKPNNFEEFQYQTMNTNAHWNVSMGMNFGSSLPPQHLDTYTMLHEDARQQQVDSQSSPVSVGTKLDPTTMEGLRGSSPLSSIEYVQQGKAKPGFFPPNVNAPRIGMPNPPPVAKSAGHTQDHIMAERKRREKLSQRFIALSAIVPGLKKVHDLVSLFALIVHS